MRKMGRCLTTLEASCLSRSVTWRSTRSAIGLSWLSLTRLQGTGNRRAAARTRHPPSADDASGDDDGRPAVLGGGEPSPAPSTLAPVHHHAGHIAPLESALCRHTMEPVTSLR